MSLLKLFKNLARYKSEKIILLNYKYNKIRKFKSKQCHKKFWYFINYRLKVRYILLFSLQFRTKLFSDLCI